MRLACFVFALLLTACGSSAPLPPPPIEAPPAAPVVVEEAPQPEPEEAPAVIVPVPEPPPPPPPKPPRLSIRAQSVYPAVGLHEWTLANGATVVYKRVGAPGPLRLLAFAEGGWTALDPGSAALAVLRVPGASEEGASLGATERQIRGRADEVRPLMQRVVDAFAGPPSTPAPPRTAVDALDGLAMEVAIASLDGAAPQPVRLFADPDELTVVIVGDADPALVAAEAGRLLAGIEGVPGGLAFGRARPSPARRSRVARNGDNGVLDLALRAPLGRAGAAGLGVLRIALEDALTNAGLGRLRVEAAPAPWTDTGWLRVVVESSDAEPDDLAARVRSTLESPQLDLSAARAARLRQLGDPNAEAWLLAVAALYRDGDGERPGQNPAALDPLSGPLERVSLDDLRALARRFATSDDAAMILLP